MPTLCGLRRRGYTASSILDFIGRIGVSKANSMVNIELLEHCIREELNNTAARRIAVLKPIKVIIDNYPEDKVEYFDMPNNPNDPKPARERFRSPASFTLTPTTLRLFPRRSSSDLSRTEKYVSWARIS